MTSAERRRRYCDTVVALKLARGAACQRCGYNKSLRSLAFHHRDPRTKSFTIGHSVRSDAPVIAEAEKCELICANCHTEHEWAGTTAVFAVEL